MLCITIVLGLLTAIYLWLKKRYAFHPELVRGRRVLVTGSSKGIGEALAYQYAKLGASVFVTARTEDLLQQVVEKCKRLGSGTGRYGYYVADMLNYKTESKKLVQACVAALGGIDTVIVNHIHYGTFHIWVGSKEDLDMFEKATDVNYKSYVHIMSHALPYLRKSNYGRIGVVGSIGGKFTYPLITHYNGAKFGLEGFFNSLRSELDQAKENLSVTISVLGFVSTKNVVEILKTGFQYWVDYGSGDNVKKRGAHVIATPDDAAYATMCGIETAMREVYYPFWFRSAFLKIPTYTMPLVRHLAPNWLVPVVWKPKIFKEFRENTKL